MVDTRIFTNSSMLGLLGFCLYSLPFFANEVSEWNVVSRKLGNMTMYEFQEGFIPGRERTEYAIYNELKQNPIDAPVTYLAISWFYFFESRTMDKALQALKGLSLKNAFTVVYQSLTDEIEKKGIIELLSEIGVTCIFTPKAGKSLVTVGNNIFIRPMPYYALNSINPAPIKDILVSFIGYESHEIRRGIYALDTMPGAYIKKTNEWIAADSADLYKDILARSRFSLCPRGYATNSIRFWESLCAGAIPILISNDALLPEYRSWEKTIIRINEDAIGTIKEILARIDPRQEELMRKRCLHAYRRFSGKNIVSPIRKFYQKTSPVFE